MSDREGMTTVTLRLPDELAADIDALVYPERGHTRSRIIRSLLRAGLKAGGVDLSQEQPRTGAAATVALVEQQRIANQIAREHLDFLKQQAGGY